PRCEAEVSSESEIAWRTGNEQAINKAQRLGVDLYQCFMTGTYLVGNRWYCKRHAALIALDLLAEKP
ncbi:MAG TPA: hypothetical protein VN843_01920, partial [Anaerolineales bacterium]|nr:hypothetical protein [Anaerolineales bacterium]